MGSCMWLAMVADPKNAVLCYLQINSLFLKRELKVYLFQVNILMAHPGIQRRTPTDSEDGEQTGAVAILSPLLLTDSH